MEAIGAGELDRIAGDIGQAVKEDRLRTMEFPEYFHIEADDSDQAQADTFEPRIAFGDREGIQSPQPKPIRQPRAVATDSGPGRLMPFR